MGWATIILTKVGSVVFKAREEFAKTTTLEDPFAKDRAWYENITELVDLGKGSFSIQHCEPKDPSLKPATQEEKDAYRRAENEFVAERVFTACGWDDYSRFCDECGIEMCHNPCEFGGQCSMFCKKFPCSEIKG